MSFANNRTSLMLMLGFSAMLVLSSCTCMIKEEQQAMINQLRTEEKQLNSDIAKADSDKSRISNELNNRQAELRKCNERMEYVKAKMSKWPNIWPDYNPNAPAPDAGVIETTTKKKRK